MRLFIHRCQNCFCHTRYISQQEILYASDGIAVCYEIIANTTTTTTSTTTTPTTTTTTTTIKKRPITCANKTKQLSQWLQTNVIIFRLVSRKN